MNSEHAKAVAGAPSGPDTGKRFLRFASRFTVQIALLLLILAFSILSPDFLQPGNWSNIIQQSSIIAIAACGATLVIITAGIDLSVGSVVALSGICAAGLVINQLLAHTVFGHEVYAIGGNREAARLAGINVARVEMLVYMLAGGWSGFAGLVLTGRLSAAMPSSATGLELDVIAAVVIGGASLFGGKGNMIGTFFGVLTIGVLRNGLNLLNVSPFWVQFVQGAVIFVAVLLDAIGQRQRR